MTALVLLAALAVLTSAAGISAYLTATDSGSNTFTLGDVAIDLQEENWDPSLASDMRPGKVLTKDPKVENTGTNPCFAFIQVDVPKKDIYTYDPSAGQDLDDLHAHARNPLAVTELFTLPEPNSGWTLISTDTSAADKNTYVYAYGNSSQMTTLAKGASTPTVFDSVQYCYAVEGQGLDTEILTINVKAYGIQTTDITLNDKTDPASIWNVIMNTTTTD